jgi:hypothetical protein
MRLGSEPANTCIHVALMLHGRPHRVLDRPAVEAGMPELVERDDHLAAAGLGEASRQRETSWASLDRRDRTARPETTR